MGAKMCMQSYDCGVYVQIFNVYNVIWSVQYNHKIETQKESKY